MNTISNTTPLVLHAQGASHKEKSWSDMVLDHLDTMSVSGISDKITIVTFQAVRDKMVLTEQLRAQHIPYHNAADAYGQKWMNKLKIPMMQEILKKITTPYVMALDALDVILTEDLTSLIERFREFDCSLLYGASVNNYPHSGSVNTSDTASRFKYLNAGTLIGKTEFLNAYYKHIMDHVYSNVDFGQYVNSEQARIRYAFANQPDGIKIDARSHIFQTLMGVKYYYNQNTQILWIS